MTLVQPALLAYNSIMIKFSLRITVLFLLSTASPAFAGLSPLAVSVAAPVQVPSSDFDVVGARMSLLWGEQREVYGLDVGAVGNISNVASGGTAVAGGFNYNRGTTTILGAQIAGIANIDVNKTRGIGLQVAGLLNSNRAESSFLGFQIAAVNQSPFMSIAGIQAGLYNHAHSVTGLQIGLINVTDSLHGLQIGLGNINSTGLFSFAPFLNIGF